VPALSASLRRCALPAALAALAALAVVVCSSGCRGKPVTRAECDRLLDRYTEMLARADNARPTATELDKARGQARALAAHDADFQACPAELSREQMDCALASFNPDEIERCLVPVP
jgi:methylthioribose-1-phosphate isomerase